MKNFIIGVLSSISAVVIVYIFRYYIGFLISILFYRVYPRIVGEYKIYSYRFDYEKDGEPNYSTNDHNNKNHISYNSSNQELLTFLKAHDAEPYIKATFYQIAHKVKGEITITEQGQLTDTEKFYGKIMPSRVLVLNSESKTQDHHNFGTLLLTITPNNRIIKGVRTYLCIECGDAASGYILLEKIK